MIISIKAINYREKQLYNKYSIQGGYYFSKNNYDLSKAEYAYLKASTYDPLALKPHFQLARIYFVAGQNERALSEINTAIAINPDFKGNYYIRGLINGYMRRFEAAESDFKLCLSMDGKSANTWASYNDLTWIYLRQRDYENAVETARQGLSVHPDNLWLTTNLGVALYNQKDYQQAKEVLLKAKELYKDITPEKWDAAYPGNDPGLAQTGISNISLAISYNLSLVYKELDDVNGYNQEFTNIINLDKETYKELL